MHRVCKSFNPIPDCNTIASVKSAQVLIWSTYRVVLYQFQNLFCTPNFGILNSENFMKKKHLWANLLCVKCVTQIFWNCEILAQWKILIFRYSHLDLFNKKLAWIHLRVTFFHLAPYSGPVCQHYISLRSWLNIYWLHIFL